MAKLISLFFSYWACAEISASSKISISCRYFLAYIFSLNRYKPNESLLIMLTFEFIKGKRQKAKGIKSVYRIKTIGL